MYHFYSWVPIWTNRRRMSCRLSRIARSVDNGKKLIWVFMSVCRVPWNTRDFSASYPAVTVKCEDAGTCQYGRRYMSIWTPIHVNINAGTCQEERRYMSTWTPAMSTWTPVHINMDAGTCQYELRYVSIWTPVRVNMNAGTCQYERRYVSPWTPVCVNMNARYMSVWTPIHVNMNAGTCQYEQQQKAELFCGCLGEPAECTTHLAAHRISWRYRHETASLYYVLALPPLHSNVYSSISQYLS